MSYPDTQSDIRPKFNLAAAREMPNPVDPSWWTHAPVRGLTALATAQLPRMCLSKFSRLNLLAEGPIRPGTIETYRAKKAFAARVRPLLVLLAWLVAAPAFAQTTPGLQFDFAATGLEAGKFLNCAPVLEMNGGFRACDVNPYPDFNYDGNRNTIELTETRLSPSGVPEYDLRITRVQTSPSIRFCVGEWFSPVAEIAQDITDPADWLIRWYIANVGGRHVLWYRTAKKFGFRNVLIPSCAQ